MSMHVPPIQIPTPEEALMNRRAHTTEACHHLLNTGEDSLTLFPPRLLEAFEIEAWKDHLTPNRALVRCDDFVDWIVSPFPKGLGSSLDIVKTILVNAKDKSVANRALEMFDRAQRRSPGNQSGRNQHSLASQTGNVDNVHVSSKRPTGNSSAAGIRRLEREASRDGEAGERARQHLCAVRSGQSTVHGALRALDIRKKPPAHEDLSAVAQIAILMDLWSRSRPEAREEFRLLIERGGSGSGRTS